MKYRLLGRSGLRVSEAALGTMTFGEEWGWGAAKDEARKVYETYREAGGNFIDTANVYTNGSSEQFVGEFIKDHRPSIVLSTKYSNAMPGNDANAAGNHRKSMMQVVEASLHRLQTDYIDLYWVHIWDQMTSVEEVMRGLDDLVSQGKILYAGVSDARHNIMLIASQRVVTCCYTSLESMNMRSCALLGCKRWSLAHFLRKPQCLFEYGVPSFTTDVGVEP